jgi:hypothetical protein
MIAMKRNKTADNSMDPLLTSAIKKVGLKGVYFDEMRLDIGTKMDYLKHLAYYRNMKRLGNSEVAIGTVAAFFLSIIYKKQVERMWEQLAAAIPNGAAASRFR